jgi:hypothetical protein
MNGTGDPLNIDNKPEEEKVEIIYRPYDRYTELAEHIVNQWTKYLKMKGIIKGELGYSDELEMLIAEEMRKDTKICN